MIDIKTIGTWGFEGAIRGMRMPYESFDKSDSIGCDGCDFFDVDKYSCTQHGMVCPWGKWLIGENDHALCKKLIKSGSEHRKFLRMIHVQAEVKAPRYWWAEMDKYKWVEANSSSTMHLITKRHLRTSDFSTSSYSTLTLETIIGFINKLMDKYDNEEDKETKDKIFVAIKQLLPESYNQLRMIDLNYETALTIWHQRHNHRLDEWREFSDWIEGLPYMEDFLEALG